MTYKTVTCNQEVNAVDILTMETMSVNEYEEYLRSGLLSVDHHDVLRSEPAGYPLAVSKEQLDLLIEYLNSIKHKVGK